MPPSERNFYYEVPGVRHTPSDWMSRIHLLLKAFFGTKPESMEVVLECIPSQSIPGLQFRRMNPIVTLTNGI